jgi:hypothetical protein
MAPTLELPPATPLTLHVTALFDVPETFALNCFVVVAGTLADEGATVTVIGGAAVMLSCTAAVVTAPVPVLVTVTGSVVPTWAAVAVPVAVRPVAEFTTEGATTPPIVTTEFAP